MISIQIKMTIEMEMFIDLLVFSALLTTCLAVALPKSMLIRLCETARSARGLGSSKREVIQAKEVNSYNGHSELASHHKERNGQMFDINPSNYGVNQIVSVLNYDREYIGDWPMGLLNVASELVASRQTAGNSSLGLTIENQLFNPNLTMYYLRQDEKAKQLIENYMAKLTRKFSPKA